jgi:hypothetical protein
MMDSIHGLRPDGRFIVICADFGQRVGFIYRFDFPGAGVRIVTIVTEPKGGKKPFVRRAEAWT